MLALGAGRVEVINRIGLHDLSALLDGKIVKAHLFVQRETV